jgi:tetratricopeptide (TPR) repeat protein
MIFVLAAAASLASQSPPATTVPSEPAEAAPADPSVLRDAAQAIDSGRLQEAKLIIARAISAGFRGAPIERLTADLSFASGKYLQSMVAYQHLAGSSDKKAGDCEKGAISALHVGRIADARPLVECAVQPPDASWRAWNARGVLADLTQDWAMADQSYARAHKLDPNNSGVINNRGWSMLLRGDWAGAITYLQEAAALDKNSERIANNLELAKAALAAELPKRRTGESDHDWAARLNDAGVAAEMLGDNKRAVAAFTQAIDASPAWYDRASNNLQALSQN